MVTLPNEYTSFGRPNICAIDVFTVLIHHINPGYILLKITKGPRFYNASIISSNI